MQRRPFLVRRRVQPWAFQRGEAARAFGRREIDGDGQLVPGSIVVRPGERQRPPLVRPSSAVSAQLLAARGQRTHDRRQLGQRRGGDDGPVAQQLREDRLRRDEAAGGGERRGDERELRARTLPCRLRQGAQQRRADLDAILDREPGDAEADDRVVREVATEGDGVDAQTHDLVRGALRGAGHRERERRANDAMETIQVARAAAQRTPTTTTTDRLMLGEDTGSALESRARRLYWTATIELTPAPANEIPLCVVGSVNVLKSVPCPVAGSMVMTLPLPSWVKPKTSPIEYAAP